MNTKQEKEREVARLTALLNEMPYRAVRSVGVKQLIEGFNVKLSRQTVTAIRREVRTAMEEEMAQREVPVEKIGNQIVLERIAAIVTKSYPHLGDNEKISTEDALQAIYRELKFYDPSLLTRNEKRALPKSKQTPMQTSSTRS